MYKIFRRVSDESKHNPHPNVLPIIEVSETLFPFCIMAPWMPDGNITQYTQANPSTDRLMLARAYKPANKEDPLTPPTSSPKRAAALCTFVGWAFCMVVSLR